jgi:signal transduction histidine kinase
LGEIPPRLNVERTKNYMDTMNPHLLQSAKLLNVNSAVNSELSRAPMTFLKVQIKDTGIGITSEHQEKLFKLFSGCKLTNNINQGGIGIGLTVCKILCEALGGNI